MKRFTHDQREEFDLLEQNHYVSKQAVKKENEQAKKIAIYSILFGIGSVIFSFGMCFYALQTSREAKKVEQIVYQDDGQGNVTVMKELRGSVNFSVNQEKKERYLKNQLAEYIKALYSVPNSKDMMQENANKVIFMTQKEYYAAVPQKIFQGAFNPKNITGVITVDVTTGSPTGAGVWQFNWTKKLNGDVIGKFKTWITFNQIDIQSQVIADYNPFGIVVTNIDTQADL